MKPLGRTKMYCQNSTDIFSWLEYPGGGATLFLAGEVHGRCEKAKRTRRYHPMGRHVPASRHWFV